MGYTFDSGFWGARKRKRSEPVESDVSDSDGYTDTIMVDMPSDEELAEQ